MASGSDGSGKTAGIVAWRMSQAGRRQPRRNPA